MKTKGIEYQFDSVLWKYPGKGGWHFVALPKELSKEIRNTLKSEEQGWGRLSALAKIGNSEWKTAVWYDTKLNTYLLPLKKEVRKKEFIQIDKQLKIILWI